MDAAKYMVISRQGSLFKTMDVIAQNVANSSSTGFKAELTYQQKVQGVNGRGEHSEIGTVTDFSQGPMRITGRPLDVAINGEGFFVVKTPLGDRYTRAGNFRLDTKGSLVTQDGYKVQGKGGKITFGETDVDVTINKSGIISAKVNGISEEKGTLKIVKFDDTKSLKKIGNSLYSTAAIAKPADPLADFSVAQATIEDSNVSSVKEMTAMIGVNRSVGSTGQFLNDIQELQRRTISTLTSRR